MIRDLVAGVLCGGLVSAVGLGVISQIAPGPQAGEQPVLASKTAAADAPSSSPAAAAVPEPAKPATPPTPKVEAAPPASQTSAAPPKIGAAPAVPGGGAVEPPATAGPVSPEPQAPGLPASGGAAPAAQSVDAAPAPVAQAPANPPPVTAPPSPAAPAVPAAAPLPTAEVPPPAAGKPADRLLEPGAEPAPAPPPAEVAPAPEPATPPKAEIEAGDEAAAKPKLLQPGAAPQLDPAPGLPKSADGVKVGRLPTIGAAPAVPAAPEASPPADGPTANLPPLQRYAAKFANPSGKPLFALILTDDGSPQLDRAKLAALPFAVTFAIDPLAPNAAEAAATYRAGGKEVVILASGLPAGATAADVEQSLQAMTAALPESVAVIDMASKGFQDDRTLASQIVTILKADGRGLITYDRGLNAADQVARRDDLPAAVVFRDLDGQGEEVPMIRRYLDRAAFKAAQEGRVAVVGTTRPETVAAILEWSIEGRASSVTLAPASAVMVVQ